jgi:arylamine N-acetyltransferase
VAEIFASGNTDLLAGGAHQIRRRPGRLLAPGVRGEDHRVAAGKGEQCLDRRRRVRPGGRDQRGHHADRLGDAGNAPLRVAGHHADGRSVAHIRQHAEHPALDLGDLVFVLAEPGLVDGQPGESL